jgi:outer membrane protein assembly factor BamB
MYHGGSFADIDEDGKPEIVIGCYDGKVYLLNAEDGSLEWEYPTSSYVGAPTSVADLNNDGHLEIVLVSYNRLIVISHEGDYLWDYTTGGNIFRGAAIADIDGNDTLDVVFGSDDGILRALKGSDGEEVWTYNLQSHYGKTFEMDHAPVIGDFDNDGMLDVFMIGGYGTSSSPTANHGRAYALRAGIGEGLGWPMFRHDIRHSGCFTSTALLCGDADGNHIVNISDAVYLIAYIFGGGTAPDPLISGDSDCNEIVNISDAVYLIAYIFGGGPAPCAACP